MNLVRVEAFAQGYYSEQVFEDYFLLPKDFYEEHKNLIDNFTFYVSELNGKHSEIKADITVREVDNYIEFDYRGSLLDSFEEFLYENDIEKDFNISQLYSVYEKLKDYEEFIVRVKKDKVDEFKKIIVEFKI